MKYTKTRSLTILFFMIVFCSVAQIDSRKEPKPYETNGEEFVLRGVIKNKDTWEGIKGVKLSINDVKFAKTNSLGEFKIKALLNEELVIMHPSFDKISYKIITKDKLSIYVENGAAAVEKIKKKYKQATSQAVMNDFNMSLDNAEKERKIDAEKSIDYISKALEIALANDLDKSNTARAYEKLGRIYLYWKQYDLAISNFNLSNQLNSTTRVQLALAKAYYLNKEYNRCIQTFKSIDQKKLSNYELVLRYEGLGDAYLALQQGPAAENNYTSGLKLAEKHFITPKITDLNSKIGDVYAQVGAVKDAKNFYENSLQLAEDENLKRSIVEGDKVADFLSSNNNFSEEIELRKKNLEQVKELPVSETTGRLESQAAGLSSEQNAISSQRLNYKIGDAYFKQSKFEEAIPYLEESIKEANTRADLVVEKDATRKLSEVYEKVDYVKAYETFKSYVDLVEKLYAKKEQEIVSASRFSKKLSSSQNRITSLEKDRDLTENKINLALKDSQLAQESNRRQTTIIYSLIFGLLLLTLLVYYMYRNVKQQKVTNDLLALKQLRSQMNPHFIFNALNSVNSFIATNDERTANRYLSEFSQLMRTVLENSEADFIPLSKEIELLTIYTKLEHFRFQDKFDYDIRVDDDIEIDEFKIPPMLLQPYVENAVWHGLRYKKEKGELVITVSYAGNDILVISIEDDGIGREQSKKFKTQHQKKQQSKGMGNIKKRVAILNDIYQDKVAVAIEDKPNQTGTKVILTLKKD